MKLYYSWIEIYGQFPYFSECPQKSKIKSKNFRWFYVPRYSPTIIVQRLNKYHQNHQHFSLIWEAPQVLCFKFKLIANCLVYQKLKFRLSVRWRAHSFIITFIIIIIISVRCVQCVFITPYQNQYHCCVFLICFAELMHGNTGSPAVS